MVLRVPRALKWGKAVGFFPNAPRGYVMKAKVVALTALTLVLLLPGPAYAARAAEWHMESLPQMTDTSGNGNHGTAQSTVTLTSGVNGNGYDFNPVNGASYVTVPDSDTLDPGTADISVTAHVRFTVVPETDYNVVRKGLGTAAGGYYKMEIKKKVKNDVAVAWARCQFKGVRPDGTKATTALMKGPNLADGAWHRIVCRKTATTIELAIDSKSYRKSSNIGSISNASTLTVARNEDGDDQYPGHMDEVSVNIGS
jgi:hypothetical protein